MLFPTHNSAFTSAHLCRINGWDVGTMLEGDEGFGVTRIVITAIGERNILARKVAHDNRPVSCYEASWTLRSREWQRVECHE